jgi:hypothetical protein
MKYLSDNNAKTTKGEELGIYTVILYLAPANESGVINTCQFATACKDVCLFKAGRGAMDFVITARVNRTIAFANNPKLFVENLASDIEEAQVTANNKGMKLAVRLNGTSDLPWEKLGGFLKVNLMDRFPTVAFYDYTKNASRAELYAQGEMPKNYHLTFSRSECNGEDAKRLLSLGINIACVFSTAVKNQLPQTYLGKQVIDGDVTDIRFIDPKGVVVGLRAKGPARKDESGFVVHI